MSNELEGWQDIAHNEILEDDKQFGKREGPPRVQFNKGEKKVLRIVRKPTQSKFYVVRKNHWGIPVGSSLNIPQTCAWTHAQQQCFFCDKTSALYDAGDPVSISVAKKIKGTVGYSLNVIEMGDALNEDGTVKIKVWNVTRNVWNSIKKYTNPDAGYGDITHPITGRDLMVELEVKGQQGGNVYTQYSVNIEGSPSSIKKRPQLKDIDFKQMFESIYDLEETYPLNLHNYATQQGIFEGTHNPLTGKKNLAIEDGGAADRKQLGSGEEEFERPPKGEDFSAPAPAERKKTPPVEVKKAAPMEEPEGEEESWDDLGSDEDEASEDTEGLVDASEDDEVARLKAKLKAMQDASKKRK